MERHEEMLSPEEQYAQLAPTLDADVFSLYAAAEEVTGLKVYEEFPYEDTVQQQHRKDQNYNHPQMGKNSIHIKREDRKHCHEKDSDIGRYDQNCEIASLDELMDQAEKWRELQYDYKAQRRYTAAQQE